MSCWDDIQPEASVTLCHHGQRRDGGNKSENREIRSLHWVKYQLFSCDKWPKQMNKPQYISKNVSFIHNFHCSLIIMLSQHCIVLTLTIETLWLFLHKKMYRRVQNRFKLLLSAWPSGGCVGVCPLPVLVCARSVQASTLWPAWVSLQTRVWGQKYKNTANRCQIIKTHWAGTTEPRKRSQAVNPPYCAFKTI